MDQSTPAQKSTGEVTAGGIKEILNREERGEHKKDTVCILKWLDSDRLDRGDLTMLEFDSFQKLEKIFPYKLLFGTLREKYLPDNDLIVAKRLKKLTSLHPDFFSKENTRKIRDYLLDSSSPSFDFNFYTSLSAVESMIVEVLNEIEEGENDQYLVEMSKVMTEIQSIQSHLLESIDAGDSSENDE